jgi:hypothetical protein
VVPRISAGEDPFAFTMNWKSILGFNLQNGIEVLYNKATTLDIIDETEV